MVPTKRVSVIFIEFMDAMKIFSKRASNTEFDKKLPLTELQEVTDQKMQFSRDLNGLGYMQKLSAAIFELECLMLQCSETVEGLFLQLKKSKWPIDSKVSVVKQLISLCHSVDSLVEHVEDLEKAALVRLQDLINENNKLVEKIDIMATTVKRMMLAENTKTGWYWLPCNIKEDVISRECNMGLNDKLLKVMEVYETLCDMNIKEHIRYTKLAQRALRSVRNTHNELLQETKSKVASGLGLSTVAFQLVQAKHVLNDCRDQAVRTTITISSIVNMTSDGRQALDKLHHLLCKVSEKISPHPLDTKLRPLTSSRDVIQEKISLNSQSTAPPAHIGIPRLNSDRRCSLPVQYEIKENIIPEEYERRVNVLLNTAFIYNHEEKENSEFVDNLGEFVNIQGEIEFHPSSITHNNNEQSDNPCLKSARRNRYDKLQQLINEYLRIKQQLEHPAGRALKPRPVSKNKDDLLKKVLKKRHNERCYSMGAFE